MECSVEDCGRPHVAQGLCEAHYRRKRRGKPLEPPISERGRTCSVEACAEPHVARGFCSKHYRRWQRWGDPLGGRPRRKTPKDFNWRIRRYLKCRCIPERGDVRTVEGWAAGGRRPRAGARQVFKGSRMYCLCETEGLR